MEINNTQDIIDCKNVLDRIEELESNFDCCPHCGEGLFVEESEETNRCPDCEQELLDDDEKEELAVLKKLGLDGTGFISCDGALIRESYFVEYCREFCEDCGEIPSELASFIENHIDWEGVAEDLKPDYMEIDFDGVSYFIRG